QTRQPFRSSCAPHSAQKLGWYIVGGTPVLKVSAIIFNCLSEEYHRVERSRCSYCSFATWRSLLLPWHFKFGGISNGKMGNDPVAAVAALTLRHSIASGLGTPGCKVQRAAGILSYPSEHLRLLIGRP